MSGMRKSKRTDVEQAIARGRRTSQVMSEFDLTYEQVQAVKEDMAAALVSSEPRRRIA